MTNFLISYLPIYAISFALKAHVVEYTSIILRTRADPEANGCLV